MSDVVFDVFDLSTDPDASGGPVASFSVDLGTGATGPTGPAGASVSAAAGAPSGSANAGDLYINTTNGDLYRWS